MEEKTIIKYNGVNPFVNQPTPFVELSTEPVRYGKFWGKKDTITLKGQIYVKNCNGNFSALMALMNSISNSFSQDFKTFEIFDVDENGVETEVYSKDWVRITNISFDENNTSFIKDYTISLDCYDFEYSSDLSTSKVINPSVSISYSMTENGEISVEISGKASGVKNSSDNPLQGAITYVNSKVDINTITSPTERILGYNKAKAVLKSKKENIDRISHSYELTKNYVLSRAGSIPYILDFSVEISYNEEAGIYEVSIDGSISGQKTDTSATLNDQLNKLNFYSLCLSNLNSVNFSGGSNPPGLNPNPTRANITENLDQRSISFGFSYNSDLSSGGYDYDYTTTVDYNDEEGTHSVSYSGEVKGRLAQQESWNIVKSAVPDVSIIRGICSSALSEDSNGGSVVLENEAEQLSYEYDERSATVKINCTFNQRKTNSTLPLKNMSEKVDINKSTMEKKIVYLVGGNTKFEDMNAAKRGSVSATVSGISEDKCNNNVAFSLESYVLSLCRQYGGEFLEDVKITISETDGGAFEYSGTATMSAQFGKP
jgi:hypothetical protein